MNNLPNTSFNYDAPRLGEMQGFLDHISTIIRDNPELYVSKDIVYRELCRWGVKNKDLGPDYFGMNISPMFNMWEDRYKNTRSIDVFCSPDWPYFCQFVHDLPASDGFIKLYINIDKDHIFRAANELFDYIKSTGIKHQSKIAKNIRSDNIVIRLPLDDMDSAKKIISYVNSSPYIKAGMNKVNPFVPSINGVGYMTESGISYNSELSEQISNYLNYLKKQGQYFGSVDGLRQYVSKYAYHKEVVDTLNNACGAGIKKVVKQEAKPSMLNADQKYNLFMDAMKATLKKYGIIQVQEAVYMAIAKGDYSYFTNGDRVVKYRAGLIKNVTPSEIGTMVYSSLEASLGRNGITGDLRRNVDNFCNLVFRNSQALLLDEICSVTLENYSSDQVRTALVEFIRTGHTGKFSRFVKGGDVGVNYRDMVSRLDRNEVANLIKRSLALKGKKIEKESLYYLVDEYAKAIELGKYAQNSQIEGLSRKAL